MASIKIMQNRIAKYIEKNLFDPQLYPNASTYENGLEAKEGPYMVIGTDYQLITIKCDSEGNIETTTRMRRGQGTEKDFNKRLDAFETLRREARRKKYADYIKKESFSDGWIKLTGTDHILTLTFNPETKEINIKERARRGSKKQEGLPSNVIHNGIVLDNVAEDTLSIPVPKNLDPSPDANVSLAEEGSEFSELFKVSSSQKPVEVKTVIQDPKTLHPQIEVTPRPDGIEEEVKENTRARKASLPKISHIKAKPIILEGISDKDLGIVEEKKYEYIESGTEVINIYNNKGYKVISDRENVIEVFDPAAGYLIMARADLKLSK